MRVQMPRRLIFHATLILILALFLGNCGFQGESSSRSKDVEEMTAAEARELLKNTRRGYGEVPFLLYMREGNARMVKLHLKAGMNPDTVDKHRLLYGGTRNEPVLIYAVSGNSPEIALALIDAGADVTIKDNNGMTPLMYAVLRDNPDLVKALIEAGADVNARVGANMTVLVYAVLARRIDSEDAFIGLLMGAVTGLNSELHGDGRSGRGGTGSAGTTFEDSAECVKLLLDAGAEVDAQTGHGETALMYAAYTGRIEKVKVLLEYGADPDLTNMQGETALKMAKKRGRTDIMQVLREAGAEK